MDEFQLVLFTGFLFSLLGIVISIIGWFIIDLLTRYRVRKELQRSVKEINYLEIFQSMEIIAEVITISKNIKVDIQTPNVARESFKEWVPIIIWFPSSISTRNILNDARNVLPLVIKYDSLRSKNQSTDNMNQLTNYVDKLQTTISVECIASLNTAAYKIKRSINALQITGFDNLAPLFNNVGDILDQGFGILDSPSDQQDFKQWIEKYQSLREEIIKEMQNDLNITIK